jgi:hypothetical protein
VIKIRNQAECLDDGEEVEGRDQAAVAFLGSFRGWARENGYDIEERRLVPADVVAK